MARNHRDEGTVALIDRDVERAADTYTRAAYGTLAGFENEGEGSVGGARVGVRCALDVAIDQRNSGLIAVVPSHVDG